MDNQDNQGRIRRPHLKFKLARDRDPRTFAILEFIKSNQTNKYGITMDKVANYMNEKGFCSRPTTRILVSSLKEEGFLEEKERRNKYFHDLVVKEGYDFEPVLQEIFLSYVYDIKELLIPLQALFKDKDLGVNFHVDKSPKDEITYSLSISLMKQTLTPKQMQKYKSDLEQKMIKKQARR